MTAPMRIYLAGPLFTQAERRWNRELARCLCAAIPSSRVALPQDRARKFIDGDKIDFDGIVQNCMKTIESCDVMIAIFDGPDADSGTSWECGYARAHNKPVIGVRTDLRSSEDDGVNAMLRRTCSVYIRLAATDENIERLSKRLALAIRKFGK
jgi:nucleoside 2-deoxyribosyltransferase